MITLMYSNYLPSADHIVRLEKLAGTDHVVVAANEETAIAHAASTKVVLGHRYLRQILPHAPGLRWVQTSAGGFDHLPWEELAARGIMLSRNPLNAPAIAHHVVALAWALLRRLPDVMNPPGKSGRASRPDMLPLPRTALILGLGAIGMQTAKLLRGLGLLVRGTALNETDEQRAACDEILSASQWRDVLPATDILVLALPLNNATRHCLGERELAALPSHAIVINVARAAIIDQDCLLDALNQGRLGGAALDVLDPIPLPDDRIWRTPNLLITPKMAAYHPGMQKEFEAFAEAQVSRYLSGMQLEAVVDFAAPELRQELR